MKKRIQVSANRAKLLPTAELVWNINGAGEMESFSPHSILDGEDIKVLDHVDTLKESSEKTLHRFILKMFWHQDAKIGLNSIVADLLKLDCCSFRLGFITKH